MKITYIFLKLSSALPTKCLSDTDGSLFKQICYPTGGTGADIAVLIINILLGLAGGLATLFIILGGIRYITSAGDSTRTEEAKQMITNAVIGVVVISLALVILNTVKSFLT